MASINFNFKEKCITPLMGEFTQSSPTNFTVTWNTSNIISTAIYNIEFSSNGTSFQSILSVNANLGTATFNAPGGMTFTDNYVRLATTSSNCGTLRSAVAHIVNEEEPVSICGIVDQESPDSVMFVARYSAPSDLGGGILEDNNVITASIAITSATSEPIPLRVNSIGTATEGVFAFGYRRVRFYPENGGTAVTLIDLPSTVNVNDTASLVANFNYQFSSPGVLTLEVGAVTGWTGDNNNKYLVYSLEDNLHHLEDGDTISTCLNIMTSVTVNIPQAPPPDA